MKVKNLYTSLAAAACLATLGQGMVSCSDEWDDHYGMEGANGTASLLQLVESRENLSDFLDLLKRTHVYNNNHRTSVTFADLLNADQSLTVWAPLDGTYNADSLRNLCQTEQGDSTVGLHFVMNHVAHNIFNMDGSPSQKSVDVRMLNDKFLPLSSRALYNAQVVDDDYNNPAKNGLLHVVDDDAQYTYNLYEGMTSMSEFDHIGGFLKSYEEQRLDENRSIVSGIVDGKKVYSDSVMVKFNRLFWTFDQINDEDSTFVMLAPDKATWEPVYEEALSYFNFGPVAKADSIARYWTNVSLMRDLIYNRNVQRSEVDSVFSTSYSKFDWPYHVYYEPYAAGGVWDMNNVKSTFQCSNGEIWRIKEWPFTPQDIYFRPVITEGEREASRKEWTKDMKFIPHYDVPGDSVSGHAYTHIQGKDDSSDWDVTYEIRNALSGTYDVGVVILPLTVENQFNRNWEKNRFTADISYVDEEGNEQTLQWDLVENDSHKIDTVYVGRVTFPTTSYQQPNATVYVTLHCRYKDLPKAQRRNYKNKMLLDCIYLKPVAKEEVADETKRRKEAQK